MGLVSVIAQAEVGPGHPWLNFLFFPALAGPSGAEWMALTCVVLAGASCWMSLPQMKKLPSLPHCLRRPIMSGFCRVFPVAIAVWVVRGRCGHTA